MSLSGCATGSPLTYIHQHKDDLSPGWTLARRVPVAGKPFGQQNRSPPPPPLPARKAAIPLKTTHSSKEQRRIGARASKATYSQDTWLSHEVHVVEEVGATFPTLPSPLPAHPPAPELKEMGGWQSHKALSP